MPKYKIKKWLDCQYTELRRPVAEIAKECHRCIADIYYWLKKFEIPIHKSIKSIKPIKPKKVKKVKKVKPPKIKIIYKTCVNCGNKFTKHGVTLKNIYFPNPYFHNKNCKWEWIFKNNSFK